MNERLTLYKRGSFYRCYNEDSYVLARLLDYKVVMTDNNDIAGFPVNNLSKIICELEKSKINYIIYDSIKDGKIKAECDFVYENAYIKVCEDAYEYVKLRNRIERVYENLKEKINEENVNEILSQIEGIL